MLQVAVALVDIFQVLPLRLLELRTQFLLAQVAHKPHLEAAPGEITGQTHLVFPTQQLAAVVAVRRATPPNLVVVEEGRHGMLRPEPLERLGKAMRVALVDYWAFIMLQAAAAAAHLLLAHRALTPLEELAVMAPHGLTGLLTQAAAVVAVMVLAGLGGLAEGEMVPPVMEMMQL
jgi:hypothetical protein